MKNLTNKTNKANPVDKLSEIWGIINITGVVVTSKTIKFYANEKADKNSGFIWLSDIAAKIHAWAMENGFGMTSCPVGKTSTHLEILDDKNTETAWQWTSYTIK